MVRLCFCFFFAFWLWLASQWPGPIFSTLKTKASEDRNWWNLINSDGNCYRRCGKWASRLKSRFRVMQRARWTLKINGRSYILSFFAVSLHFSHNQSRGFVDSTKTLVSRFRERLNTKRLGSARYNGLRARMMQFHRLPGRSCANIYPRKEWNSFRLDDYHPWHWLSIITVSQPDGFDELVNSSPRLKVSNDILADQVDESVAFN